MFAERDLHDTALAHMFCTDGIYIYILYGAPTTSHSGRYRIYEVVDLAHDMSVVCRMREKRSTKKKKCLWTEEFRSKVAIGEEKQLMEANR